MGSFTILPGIYHSKDNTAIVAIRNHEKTAMEINTNEIYVNNDAYIAAENPNTGNNKFNISGDSLNKLKKEALEKIIRKFPEILYSDDQKLTFTH